MLIELFYSSSCNHRCLMISRFSFRYGPKMYYPSVRGSPESITVQRFSAAIFETEWAEPIASELSALRHVLCYEEAPYGGIQIVQVYSACRCLYYEEGISRGPNYGRRGAGIKRKILLVGYACIDHSSRSGYC